MFLREVLLGEGPAWRARPSQRSKYLARKAAKLCTRCGRPASGGRVLCESCLQKGRHYSERWRKGETHNEGGVTQDGDRPAD